MKWSIAFSSGGNHRQQGGTRYSSEIWSGGTDYSAVDSPRELLLRGDCPRRDSSLLALPSGRCMEQTPDSDPQLALIHPKHAMPSHSPILIAMNWWKEAPGFWLGLCHNSFCMSRHTALFSIILQPILTLRILLLTSRSPVDHHGHLNCVIGIVALATHTFQTAHLPNLTLNDILLILQKNNQM